MTKIEYERLIMEEAIEKYNPQKDGDFDEYMMDKLSTQPEFDELPPEKKSRYTQAQNRATQKYIKENYDQITIRVPRGYKTIYKVMAAQQGKSLNQFIIDKINQ